MTGHVYKKKRPVGETDERVIMHDGDASSSVTSESDHANVPVRARNFRLKLDAFVHSNKFQILVVSLVVLDCLVVIVELLINLRIFELGRQDRAFAKFLHHVNVAVLGLFVIEMAAKALALGRRFVEHRMEVFDSAVVLVSFTLGLTLADSGDNAARGVSLLIMLRLWRITKILNSMVASVKLEADRRMAKERRSRKALEREVYKLREYCLQQECELQMYRTMLQQNGIPQPTVLRAPSAPRTLNVIAEVNQRDREQQKLRQQAPPAYDEEKRSSRRSQSPRSCSRPASPDSTATV